MLSLEISARLTDPKLTGADPHGVKYGARDAAARRIASGAASYELAFFASAAETDDVAVGILNVEILRAPGGRREWLEDRRTVRDALLVLLQCGMPLAAQPGSRSTKRHLHRPPAISVAACATIAA
jgi:hypothetical protein